MLMTLTLIALTPAVSAGLLHTQGSSENERPPYRSARLHRHDDAASLRRGVQRWTTPPSPEDRSTQRAQRTVNWRRRPFRSMRTGPTATVRPSASGTCGQGCPEQPTLARGRKSRGCVAWSSWREHGHKLSQSATASPFKWTSAPDKGVGVGRGGTLERRNAGKVVAFVLASPPDHVCGSFCVSIPAVQPLDLLPWPSVGEQVSQAHGVGQLHVGFPVLTVGPDPAFSPGPHGVAIGLQPAGDLRPRQARLLLDARQAPGETPGEDGGHSAVMRSLSRHSQFHRPALAA